MRTRPALSGKLVLELLLTEGKVVRIHEAFNLLGAVRVKNA